MDMVLFFIVVLVIYLGLNLITWCISHRNAEYIEVPCRAMVKTKYGYLNDGMYARWDNPEEVWVVLYSTEPIGDTDVKRYENATAIIDKDTRAIVDVKFGEDDG